MKRLFRDAQRGNEDAVRAGLQRLQTEGDADARHCVHGGSTLLHRACLGSSAGVVALLLGEATELPVSQRFVDATDGESKTALHMAATEGSEVIVEALLRAGASVSPTKHNGWTPLMNACEKGHLNAARVLLRWGADVDVRNKEGNAALYMACRSGSTGVMREVLRAAAHGGNATPTDRDKQIQSRANAQNCNGRRAVHAAAMNGHVHVLEELVVKAGAAVDVRDSSGTTLWHEAAEHARDNILKFFQLQGAPLRADNNGRHALHAASWNGNCGTAGVLLGMKKPELGVDLQDVDGATALHLACVQGHADVAALLLAAGADTTLRTRLGGHTALELAQKWKNGDCARLLLGPVCDKI